MVAGVVFPVSYRGVEPTSNTNPVEDVRSCYHRFMQTYELTVVIERDEDGRYLAVCPALQGCYTEGDSEEEARALIADAIRLHIESRLERGEPIPAEVSTERISVSV